MAYIRDAGGIMDMYINASALGAFGSGMQATAHNIANVSTRDFEPQTYAYMSGPADQSVVFVPKTGFDQPADPPYYPDPSLGYRADIINNSVDIARETVSLIANQRAYEANAHVISALEDTSGVVLDMLV